MAAISGILNHTSVAGNAQTRALPMTGATGTGGTGSGVDTSSGDSSTISANDFLTLLVTEMRNQDPTANTDPNQYINQLVNVNSLEQLIDINKTLTADSGTSTTATGGIVSPAAATSTAKVTGSPDSSQSAAKVPSASSSWPGAAANSLADTSLMSNFRSAPGNLSVPQGQAAAQRVAEALSRRPATN